MMKNLPLYLKLSLNLLLFFALAMNALAQKLPNRQEGSVLAPANIRIDGKATEWDNKFEAYSKATEIFYTIANDDDKLYLVVHATKSRIIEKIVEGGISFIIYNQSKTSKPKTILFPLLSMDKARTILTIAGKTLTENLNSPAMQIEQPDLLKEKAGSIAKTNDDLIQSLKEIKVSGFNTITDTVPGITPKSKYYGLFPLNQHQFKIISIDNKDGIEAAAQFSEDGSFTYELAIPIKYISTGPANSPQIKYNITLNSRGEDNRFGDIIRYSRPPHREILDLDLETATDFSGEYTLAKKP